MQAHFPAAFDLERVKARANADFRALLAVHEAGHALLYSVLFGRAPQEVKINIASFEGGYDSYARLKARTRQNELDVICTTLAGRAAEAWVFGPAACTTGAEGDLTQATEDAARHVRYHGFGARLSRTDIADEPNGHINTNIAPINHAMEALLQAQYQRADAVLRAHAQAFNAIVDTLLRQGSITPQEMLALMQGCGIALQAAAQGGPDADNALVLAPFAQRSGTV